MGAGGSAGGTLRRLHRGLVPGFDAAHEATTVSTKPNVLVLFNLVVDLTNIGIAEQLPAPPRRYRERLAKDLSPTFFLAKGTPPAILFYGDQDKFIAQGKGFVERSKALGNTAGLSSPRASGTASSTASRGPNGRRARADEFLVKLGYLDPLPPAKP